MCFVIINKREGSVNREKFDRFQEFSVNLNVLFNIFIGVLQEKLLSVYQELGSDNVEFLFFKVLVEYLFIQDVMVVCQIYKVLVSININVNFIIILLDCFIQYKVLLY